MEELLKEIERLQSLMSDQQPGLYTWNEAVRERLFRIHNFTGKMLGYKK
ncbi:MAG: hypothetical protein WDA59_07285 [Methanofastidiosum sp.]|jgi:hypothetical protein